MGRQEAVGGAAEAALLLRGDHLQRVAEAIAGLLLHLDEAQLLAAADDEVELVAARPDVGAEDLPAAQAVPAPGAPLGRGAPPHASAAYALAWKLRRWIAHGPRSRTT